MGRIFLSRALVSYIFFCTDVSPVTIFYVRCPIRNETVTNHLFGVRKTDLVSKAVEINDVVAATASAPLLGFSAKDSAVRNLELAQVIAALEDIQKTNAHLEWYRKVRGVDMFYGKQSALLEMFAECECVQSHALDQIGKLLRNF